MLLLAVLVLVLLLVLLLLLKVLVLVFAALMLLLPHLLRSMDQSFVIYRYSWCYLKVHNFSVMRSSYHTRSNRGTVLKE